MTERDARKQVNEHIGRLSPTPMPDLHSGGNGMLVEAVISATGRAGGGHSRMDFRGGLTPRGNRWANFSRW
jgi:hypothetical protein